MRLTADYHTHTVFSDGDNSIADNVKYAAEAGLQEIGLTEHGFSHVFFGLRRKNLTEYLLKAREAEKMYGIRVLVGMENNIRGRSGLVDFTEADYENFDLFLAGMHVAVHYDRYGDSKLGYGSVLRKKFKIKPSKSLIRYTTDAYINAVKHNPIDVITHLNYRCFADAVEVAKCCRDYGTYLELNSKKEHLTDDELAAVVDTGVRFVVNSDAHRVNRIGDMKIAETQIERVGVPLDRIDNIDGRFPTFRFAEYKKHM